MSFIFRAAFAPSTFDPEALTVEAVASTFAPVQRHDKRGAHLEALDPAGLDTSGLIGAPLLDGHKAGESRDVLGHITAYRIEGGKLIVTIQLSTAGNAADAVTRIREGSLSKVSIGYRVSQWRESVNEQGLRQKTAARWRILEVSAVPIPADPGAAFRSKDSTMNPEELERLLTILQRDMTLPEDFATRAAGQTFAEVMAMADEEGEEIQPEPKPKRRSAPVIRTTTPANDDPAVIVTRAADALAFRMAGGELPAASREFVNMSLLDLARDSLTRSGVSTRGMSADEVMTRTAGHTTADFVQVVSNAAGKVAAQSYEAAQTPLKQLTRQRTLSNFKPSTSIRLGELGALEPMTESGEFKATSRAEHGESMRLATFGRRIDMSRQVIIDDDLGLLGDLTAALGAAAAQTEADLLFRLLIDLPALSDTIAPIHASRGNLHADTALDIEGLSTVRTAMRQVTGLDGKTVIGVAPKFLVVGPELETTAEQLLTQTQAQYPDDVNPFSGKLTLLVEPRLAESARWFVFADPARVPTLAHAYLSGAAGVQIQRQESWNTLGLSFRAFLDFGAAWTDWRGAAAAEE
jgi:HK97 family phage prohead protease